MRESFDYYSLYGGRQQEGVAERLPGGYEWRRVRDEKNNAGWGSQTRGVKVVRIHTAVSDNDDTLPAGRDKFAFDFVSSQFSSRP